MSRSSSRTTATASRAEFLPHVFERFRQQDSSTTRESPGLGLGLSIARHLVELHGGTIRAFSDGEGRGAKFVVELPGRQLDVGDPPMDGAQDQSFGSRARDQLSA